MRKLLFLTMIALLSAGTISAQSGVLRNAQRALNSNDLNEARTLIQQVVAHPETANSPAAWKLKGDIGNKAFDNERTKEMLGQQANERVMFDGLFESYAPYVKADSLGELPDARGRVRNPVRRDISGVLRANHPFYINGGIFYNEQGNYAKAADFFEIYWDIPTLPMFEGAREGFVLDSTYQTIKYYAVITALQAEDHKRVVAMLNRIANEPFIENSVFTESDVYELLASTYLQIGDSVRYLEILQAGAAKFPTNEFLIKNLINEFILSGQKERAMNYIDQAIAADPSGACDLISVKGALLAESGDMEGAIREYRRALAQDANCERALEALARQYIVQAQDLREAAATLSRSEQAASDAKVSELYQVALPFLETLERTQKGRNATDLELNDVWMLLRNVYYNLSMFGVDKSAELDAVEKQLNIAE
jgi:tetratricopeptide (TPR) repeat protein